MESVVVGPAAAAPRCNGAIGADERRWPYSGKLSQARNATCTFIVTSLYAHHRSTFKPASISQGCTDKKIS